MTSGLRINLNKSKLYGIYSASYCMEASSTFLGCKIDKLPFKFLGFLVGGIKGILFFGSRLLTL